VDKSISWIPQLVKKPMETPEKDKRGNQVGTKNRDKEEW
jgi:hypothetical protein